jgi:hypothetical protein
MNGEEIQAFIRALRAELEQYGELLARLDEQQDSALNRASERLLHSSEQIASQATVVAELRQRRQECCRALAGRLGLQAGSTCAELLPILPEPYQPLVSALVDENNNLLVRVQQRARQNHLLMARSIQLMQEFLGALVADRTGPTYGSLGAVRNSHGATCGLREMLA